MKNKYIRLATIILPILVAVICMGKMVKNDIQAFMPVPMEYVFTGEYSYDGENWYPYGEDSDISALKGDLILKGHMDSEIPEGGILNFYRNHTYPPYCLCFVHSNLTFSIQLSKKVLFPLPF